jgi:uncharacterized membrane protein YjjP (DUF1212 family)
VTDGSPEQRPTGFQLDTVRDVLLRSAALMIAGGYAIPIVEANLGKLAAAYGAPQAKALILPTVTLVSIPGRESARVEVETVANPALRLDQTAELGRILNLATRGQLSPSEALSLLNSVETIQPRRGRLIRIGGYALLSVGVGLMLRPTLFELGIVAALGAIVGALTQISSRHVQLDYLLPIVAAAVVSATACLVAESNTGANATRIIIPPIVTLLPGAIITMSIIELTANHVVSGSSRLVLGAVKLLVLALGILAGAELVGARPEIF